MKAEPERPSTEAIDQHARRNFWTLGLVQIAIRTGWIFKTENIIMPVVLDTMGGAAWLRGFLPMFSRGAYSLSPWLLSHRFNQMKRMKWGLCIAIVGMSACFAILSFLWMIAGGQASTWMPIIFFAAYASFFVCAGMTQLGFGTLQGKLVRATRRGRLMLLGNVGGAAVAIVGAAVLLPSWLRSGGGDFHWIFACSAFFFLVSALIASRLVEPSDETQQQPQEGVVHFAESWKILRRDIPFQRVAWVAFFFGTSFVLFPHYQALGHARFGFEFSDLISWIIIQNAGTAVLSMVAGLLADWRGNRLVLRLLLLGLCLLPPAALALANFEQFGKSHYWGVFVLIGLTPVTLRTLQNYTLELAPVNNYPRYLSTMGLCVAAPIMTAPLIGLAIDTWGFEEVFFGISALLFAGWLQTLRLSEPRQKASAEMITGRINVES